jgi:N-acetylmuramoyl-L-alanine amidase
MGESFMRICIDPGHGGHDPGAVFRGLEEKDICLLAGLWLRDYLLLFGHQVVMTRADDRFVAISRRAALSNEAAADLFVSLHMNADADPDGAGMAEARGGEIWIYPDSREGRLLAEKIGEEIKRAFPGEPWRGIKEEEFGVLVMTTAPAVLIEMAFIDNSETVRSMTDPKTRHEMINAIGRGILKYCAIPDDDEKRA